LVLEGYPLKIIYVADIHGGFERVKLLLSETVADLPETIRMKIKDYFQQDEEPKECIINGTKNDE
jgi:hypothetical protein